MLLIRTLAEHLAAALGLPVVVEPSRAQNAAHLRLLAGGLGLTEIWQGQGQTAESFQAQWELTLSARLLGANEDLSLLGQGLILGVRLAERLRDPFTLTAAPEAIGGGLTLDGEGLIHGARRTSSAFLRLSDDEESQESRLFLYREDWSLLLAVRVAKDHVPPNLERIRFNPQDPAHGDPFEVPSV